MATFTTKIPSMSTPVLDPQNMMNMQWYIYFRNFTNTAILVPGTPGVVATDGTLTYARVITGTSNRVTVTNGNGAAGNPTIDISSAYIGQNTITTLGTITTGTWTASSISTSYTDAKLKTLTGTSNRITIGGTSTDPTVDISASYVGQSSITTTGTVTSGTWSSNVSGATFIGNPLGTVTSGTYTPTLTNVANLDASTAYQCQYLRVGNVVTVSGQVDVDPTAGGSTQLGISLPISSNIGAGNDVAGTAFASSIAGQGAAILGDAANNRAQLQFIAVDVTNQNMYFSFSYLII